MNAKRFLLAASVVLCTIHVVFSFMGKVSFFHVLICPLFIMFVQLIMHIAFSNSIKNNDFTMIAGYKKTDPVKKTAGILNSIGLFTGIVAVVCESLFFSIYFIEAQKMVSMVLLLIFFVFLAVIVFVTNRKYSE